MAVAGAVALTVGIGMLEAARTALSHPAGWPPRAPRARSDFLIRKSRVRCPNGGGSRFTAKTASSSKHAPTAAAAGRPRQMPFWRVLGSLSRVAVHAAPAVSVAVLSCCQHHDVSFGAPRS